MWALNWVAGLRVDLGKGLTKKNRQTDLGPLYWSSVQRLGQFRSFCSAVNWSKKEKDVPSYQVSGFLVVLVAGRTAWMCKGRSCPLHLPSMLGLIEEAVRRSASVSPPLPDNIVCSRKLRPVSFDEVALLPWLFSGDQQQLHVCVLLYKHSRQR